MSNRPLRVFIGYDPRQPIAYAVAAHSVVRHASEPVSVTPLILKQLPLEVRGLTEFTYSRFLVPYLCDYEGSALFMDADQIAQDDVADLFGHGLREFGMPSRRDEHGRPPTLLVNKDQPRFEWPSVMLFNCHQCRILTPEYINDNSDILSLSWADHVGSFPARWNVMVGYEDLSEDQIEDAAILHYTMGIPIWSETNVGPESVEWEEAFRSMTHSVSWESLMGESVHRGPTLERFMRLKYGMVLKRRPVADVETERHTKLIVPGDK